MTSRIFKTFRCRYDILLVRLLETVTGNIHEVQNTLSETRAESEEHRDKESRRNNIFIYKVPESTATRAEDRNKEGVSFCLRMFNIAMHVGLSDEDLAHVFRLGRRGTSEDAARPLMVQSASYTHKNLIMFHSVFYLYGAAACQLFIKRICYVMLCYNKRMVIRA